jgi:hypothetical protein
MKSARRRMVWVSKDEDIQTKKPYFYLVDQHRVISIWSTNTGNISFRSGAPNLYIMPRKWQARWARASFEVCYTGMFYRCNMQVCFTGVFYMYVLYRCVTQFCYAVVLSTGACVNKYRQIPLQHSRCDSLHLDKNIWKLKKLKRRKTTQEGLAACIRRKITQEVWIGSS